MFMLFMPTKLGGGGQNRIDPNYHRNWAEVDDFRKNRSNKIKRKKQTVPTSQELINLDARSSASTLRIF